jgi:hypothetical protein
MQTDRKIDVLEAEQLADPLDLINLRLPDHMVPTVTVEPRSVLRRREKFAQVPWSWIEKLDGASGQTYAVALRLLFQHWKQGGEGPVKLPNGKLAFEGISRQSKWRALNDLEKRGLVIVERRTRKSPFVQVLLNSTCLKSETAL